MDFLSYLKEKVRAKKELAVLGDSFIEYHANEQLRLKPKLRELQTLSQKELEKSKLCDELVKFIRAQARKPFGVFQIPSLVQTRESTLPKLSLSDDKNIHAILDSHLSTKERLPYYKEFFQKILDITGQPKKILDLACGLNPIAYYAFSNKKTQYVAIDVAQMQAMQGFFDFNKLPAKAVSIDLIHQLALLSEYKETFDVCFLLKTLDTLESQKLYVTYDVIKAVKAKYYVASFPIKNVKGMQMDRTSKINWFEKMLPRLGLTWKTIEFDTEVVYICHTK
ncbi:MAG TPA: hypothetical protein VK158_02030 [Acidobacteriota bacterium]|nr:hypothetical protein [Acidobacteriota bacterium]